MSSQGDVALYATNRLQLKMKSPVISCKNHRGGVFRQIPCSRKYERSTRLGHVKFIFVKVKTGRLERDAASATSRCKEKGG